MKKIITIVVFMFLAVPFIFAQPEGDQAINGENEVVQAYVYAELVGRQKFLSRKMVVNIDYGQKTKFFGDDRIRGDNGRVKAFNSMIDALNFMGERGWEFVQAYTVKSGETETTHHWILKRPLYEDENGDFIPKIRRNKNRKKK